MMMATKSHAFSNVLGTSFFFLLLVASHTFAFYMHNVFKQQCATYLFLFYFMKVIVLSLEYNFLLKLLQVDGSLAN